MRDWCGNDRGGLQRSQSAPAASSDDHDRQHTEQRMAELRAQLRAQQEKADARPDREAGDRRGGALLQTADEVRAGASRTKALLTPNASVSSPSWSGQQGMRHATREEILQKLSRRPPKPNEVEASRLRSEPPPRAAPEPERKLPQLARTSSTGSAGSAPKVLRMPDKERTINLTGIASSTVTPEPAKPKSAPASAVRSPPSVTPTPLTKPVELRRAPSQDLAPPAKRKKVAIEFDWNEELAFACEWLASKFPEAINHLGNGSYSWTEEAAQSLEQDLPVLKRKIAGS